MTLQVWGEHFRNIANSVDSEWQQAALDNIPVVHEMIDLAEVRTIVRGQKKNW